MGHAYPRHDIVEILLKFSTNRSINRQYYIFGRKGELGPYN